MNLVCINCPMGCHLVVEKVNDEIMVSGNTCERGKKYAIDELTNPKRVLTTSVKINSIDHTRLAVMSSTALPKEKIQEAIKALKDVEVNAPVMMNDVVVKNILGLDVDILASRTIKE